METIVKSEERNYGIELLRIICMIMIPALHVLGKGAILATAEPGSAHYNWAWLLETFCYCAVNCFGLISGYVGYGRKTKYANLGILWLRTFFYSAIIGLLYFFITDKVTSKELVNSLFPVLSGSYWYITTYFGLFLIMPLINKALESLGKSTLYLISASFFIFFAVLPTAGSLAFSIGLDIDYDLMVNSFSLKEGYSVIWLAVLYFWGGVIKKYGLNRRYSQRFFAFLYIGSSLLAWGSLLLINSLSKQAVVYDNYIIGYLSPVIIFEALGLFCLCSNAKISQTSLTGKLIAFFAPLCLDVYLLHMQPLIVKYSLIERFLFLLDYSPVLMVLMAVGFALVMFFAGCITAKLRELLFKLLNVKNNLTKLENKIRSSFDKRFSTEETSLNCNQQ